MSVLYNCPHLDQPHPPYPPSYPSSSSSFSPLSHLYFCEECDAIRCDQCVAVEVASYFCPNCLFDVPSANVRADRNKCARSCFACPLCKTSMAIQATETKSAEGSSVSGPPYLLVCPGCKWSSREIGWEFSKPTGLAHQLQKINTQQELVQSEFDALKDHLESYVSLSSTAPTYKSSSASRNPSRHISQLTQMAAKALHRDVPGMAASSARTRTRSLGFGVGKAGKEGPAEWDDLGEYKAKGSWKMIGLENGMQDVETMRELQETGGVGPAGLSSRWSNSWEADKMSKSMHPQRISLQTKSTKRCPDTGCRHLLIQPDAKGVRMKIKMVALNYVPSIELGRRKRRIQSGNLAQPTPEELERRRRDRRRVRGVVEEEDEDIRKRLQAGEVYNFQLAFTNPLYDPIQIRLTQPHQPKSAPTPNHLIFIPTQHFTVAALKDAWAYDDDEEEDDPMLGLEGSEGASEEGLGSVGKRSRLSALGSGSLRDKRGRDSGVDKKANTTKVGLEIEVLPGATGPVEFDLEVRYKYRADEPVHAEKEASGKEGASESIAGKEEYKTFTFWIRIKAGDVASA
ncbi:dynactin p62 family-domain-containing protein [Naematelia encephala]|uniref:Dynactin subunit 4 n=1 Tax=Naematelia encephala TaxID=71784 RepID=A0A1Y2AU76_9TREE|nr:dynactin p62 family-domain-containing protein [Naematelia encephala]